MFLHKSHIWEDVCSWGMGQNVLSQSSLFHKKITVSVTKSLHQHRGLCWLHVPFLGPLAVAGRVLWNKVCPSFCPFVLLSGHFLGLVSLVLSKFWHGARNPYEVLRDRARFSGKSFSPPKMGKWTKNGPKTRFF